MAEQDSQPSKAEQRQLAVERLRRAASLPRMKDGRRPPMHVEAVSESEKPSPGTPDPKQSPPQSPPPQDTSPPQELANGQDQEQEPLDPEPLQNIEDRTMSPGPPGRSKRRSRSRSRSRGSRDFKNKARNTQSPIPPTGDSSQEEEEPPVPIPPPIAIPVLPPLLSPIPNHLAAFQQSHLLRSPTPDPSIFYPHQAPIPLPTLEALQKGLFRSNSANNAAAGRRQAWAKLTGGADNYDPYPSTTTTPTPPPFGGGLSRNNTVSGGERSVARQVLLTRLNSRIAKEAETEASGAEDRRGLSPRPKRHRRRSRGNSLSANAANVGISDSDPSTTSADTPVPPHPFRHRPPDDLADQRAQSATPIQTSSRNQSDEDIPEITPTMISAADNVGSRPSKPTRRRSVVVEEDDREVEIHGEEEEEEDDGGEEQMEEELESQQQQSLGYPGQPATPPRTLLRVPHSSDAPSHMSTDSGTVDLPVYLKQRVPSRNDVFPTSPFTTPLKEKPTEEEEEQVLYHPPYRARTPYSDIHTDGHGREISWFGDPVPIMIESDDDEDGEDDSEDHDVPPSGTEPEEENGTFEEPPLSPISSEAPLKEGPFSTEISSQSVQSVLIESERSPEISAQAPSPPQGAPTSSSQSPDESRMSPQPFPVRLSVASRIQGSDKSPLTGDEWEEQPSTAKRNGDHSSPSTWEKVKGVFRSGRRSRSNSLATRELRDNVDSSVSRESGASLASASANNEKVVETPGQRQPIQAPPLMQTPSASASILSLSPHTHAPPRGGASPIPPATSADLARYQSVKLLPFPGLNKLEEQRNRSRAAGLASQSSPDVSASVVDEDQPPLSARSYNNTPAQTPDLQRERKLSHQASDSRLLPKFNESSNGTPVSPSLVMTPSTSQGEYIDVAPSPASSHNGKISKLPMTLPGVKQWLSKNNKKLFSVPPPAQPSSSSGSTSNANTTTNESSGTERSKNGNGNKKPSLSDLLKRRGSDVGTDWEEIRTTPISTEGDFSFTPPQNTSAKTATAMVKTTSSSSSSDTNDKVLTNKHPETEKTPKAKKLIPLDLQKPVYPLDDSPFRLPSRPDPLLSSTPDPSSSLSDYPLRSTSQSSSNSSQYSVTPQGSVVIDRLEENLVRGSKNPPFLPSLIDDPPRKSVFTWPVYQVVNQKTVKDRFLFLFNDLLVIAKPVLSPHENLIDFKASAPDRQFIVKNVVLLKDIRFTPGRIDPTPRSPSQREQQPSKNSAIKGFMTQFSVDPDSAVKSLVMKNKVLEDPAKLGQLIFQTADLDRARVGEYLAKKSHKQELDAYLKCFGFVGVRVDKALRTFLFSVNVPVHNSSALDNLLDAFAGRWYEANARFVAYDRNMAGRLVRALVRLNMILHGGLADTPGPTNYPIDDFPMRDWVELLRRADPRQLLSTDLLEELHESIRQEKLCQARCSNAGGPPTQLITIRKPVPSRLTYKSRSDPIILRIPAPDPHLTIHLEGQDLQFDPPILNFTKSSEASFRIIGNELGSKTLIMCRSGANALKYTGLPLSSTLVVERAFMRNTFQIAFTDHREVKRRYMFSVADPVWALNVRTSIEQASSSASPSNTPVSTAAAKFLRVAELVAFKVLQRILIESPDAVRSNGLSAQNNHAPTKPYVNGNSNASSQTRHVRSKSRSQLYRHDAGQNELDLSYDSTSYNDFRDSDLSDTNGDEVEQPSGPVWSGEELLMQCQQNSTIPLVLSLLQVGVLSKDTLGSS